MNTNIKSTLLGGIIATSVFTALMLLAPMMGMPKMLIGNMLAGFLGIPLALGWVMHFVIGIILAAAYVFIWKNKFPAKPVTNAIIFALLPFFMAQLLVMPMMGAGLFSGNTPAPLMMVMGSLIGHIVYGATLGAVTK